MEKPLVYIIVVNWNLRQVTLDCLNSLMQLQYPNFRIVVVDNNSQDGSPQAIAKRFPDVEHILNNKNTGSTAGYNAGFRHALATGAQYAFLINNDTTIAPDCLDLLVDACAPSDIGMVSPLVYYASAPDQVWSAGGMRNKLNLEVTGNHGRGEVHQQIRDREFVTSCALLVKRDVLENVGLMDEVFFVYQEESDYCYRVRMAEYRILLVPQAKVWHKVSLSSGGSKSPFTRYSTAKNSVIFFRKHAQPWQWFFIIPWRAGSAIRATWQMVKTKNWPAFWAYWRGLKDGIIQPLTNTSDSQRKASS